MLRVHVMTCWQRSPAPFITGPTGFTVQKYKTPVPKQTKWQQVTVKKKDRATVNARSIKDPIKRNQTNNLFVPQGYLKIAKWNSKVKWRDSRSPSARTGTGVTVARLRIQIMVVVPRTCSRLKALHMMCVAVVLQLCCSVLQCVAVLCSMFQYGALWCSAVQAKWPTCHVGCREAQSVYIYIYIYINIYIYIYIYM